VTVTGAASDDDLMPPEILARLSAIAEARCADAGPAHDFAHVLRVVANARRIARGEGARLAVAVPAALLHELFNYPKGHPESRRSGDVCAEHAAEALRAEGCNEALIEPICACIRDHAFSKGVVPDLLEARVLQDADRLDAIGAIGIARCMATCADMRRPFYAPVDPFCRERAPDDKAWGIDHFYKKLLLIPDALHTATARDLAFDRMAAMRAFLDQLAREIASTEGEG
jgi:uncharacterized protein